MRHFSADLSSLLVPGVGFSCRIPGFCCNESLIPRDQSPNFMNILVTGGAGFIGSHLVDRLLADNCEVTVVDNFDPFYDTGIKEENIQEHLNHSNYRLYRLDIRDLETMRRELKGGYDCVVHLAAKAGVRPSIEDPIAYQEVNVRGTQNLLELAKEWKTKQFIFASSSSVYGVNPKVPWSEEDHVLRPISPYASTKMSGELLGHVYSHLYGIRFLALRFFTVYGPRQRPDLAIHKFTRMISRDEAIPFFGDGKTSRDYTFVDDTVSGILGAIRFSDSQYEIFNLGNDSMVTLAEMVTTIEGAVGKPVQLNRLGEQPGDVPQTWACITKARESLGYAPTITFPEGVERFYSWYEEQERLSQLKEWKER